VLRARQRGGPTKGRHGGGEENAGVYQQVARMVKLPARGVFSGGQPTTISMKTTAHSIISSATGFGLAAFTVISFLTAGIAAPATVLGFSFLAVYGLCEMAFIDYTPLHRTHLSVVRPAYAGRVIVPAIVEFEKASVSRRAA
jgi:hypothetical protein